jgi:predicted  nucleic acid-binding Zn-ribbon protein
MEQVETAVADLERYVATLIEERDAEMVEWKELYFACRAELAEARARIATLEAALKEAREHVAALVVPETDWLRNTNHPELALAQLGHQDWDDHRAAEAWLAERGGL